VKYVFIILLVFALACKKPAEEEVFYKGSFNPVSTSANDCGLIFNLDTDGDGGSDLRSQPINPPDSVYNFLEIEVQYRLLTDSFYCTILGPSVGGANKSFVKIEILKIKE